jgi:multisubunit Na+/H+ antiporter MnhE subunit
MDELIQTVINPQTLFICLAIYVITYTLRSFIDVILNILKSKGIGGQLFDRLWNEIFLAILPIIVGGILGLMAKTFIWPDITNGTQWGRIFYGAICGLFSSFVYNRVRAWISSGKVTNDAITG